MFNIPEFNLGRRSFSPIKDLVKEHRERIEDQFKDQKTAAFLSFAEKKLGIDDIEWLQDNESKFLTNTPNNIISKPNHYLSQLGFIQCMEYSPNGESLVVGYSTGYIEMRNGFTGEIVSTLRNVQFPPKPVYAVQFSKQEEGVCYAACSDGAIYRIEVPNIPQYDSEDTSAIKADHNLDSLNVEFYSTPGQLSYSTPYIIERVPVHSFGISADQSKIIAGYADASVKIYDMQTKETIVTHKVHKLRLQFIPAKLQRNHTGRVCALRCHHDRPYMFATGAWDDTLRIWDTRCKAGCVLTFEAGPIRGDSIDLNRDHCVTGSWSPTEALSHWDLAANRRLNIIRVQNRRPNVDGEYIYTCRYWRSNNHNRKGKYVIIGGSGTKCLEIVNLHNRYIACSYPYDGTINAIASFKERIAFGGTASVFNIVTFHDPKHDKYEKEEKEEKVQSYVYELDQSSVTMESEMSYTRCMNSNTNSCVY